MVWRSSEGGFLEKMLGPTAPGRSAASIRWVGDPVRTHLALLLNTRQGALKNLPDYGLPDVSSFYSDYPASLGELRAFIEQLVKKYEPRLLNARVRLTGSDAKEFRASFLITGEIDEEAGRARVQYRTTISSSGHAAVGADLDDV
jgi:type VI secretion system lysozyme-like protein